MRPPGVCPENISIGDDYQKYLIKVWEYVAQHKEMAELYKFVVSKYLEIIPKNQQWGICQWCITDSPADSSWRKGQPTGLWDSNYCRKHTYAGFADGLAGK